MFWLIPLLTGALLMSLAVNMFLLPLKLAEGGVVGLGIILQHKLGVPIWVSMIVLNIPIVALGVRFKGWGFLWRSVVGVGAFAGFLAATTGMRPAVHETVLAIVYGGVLMGAGLGLVLRSGGTTGGTDILAIIGHKRLGISLGQLGLAIDALVLVAAAFAFSVEAALWSAITLTISSKVVDIVNEGFNAAKGLTIITTQPQPIADRIMSQVERGCTIMPGVGAFSGEPRGVLYVVASRGELSVIKNIVYQFDPRAFVVVADVHEVLGEGFRSHED